MTSPIVGAYNAGTSHDSQSTVVADNLAIFFFCMERNIYIYIPFATHVLLEMNNDANEPKMGWQLRRVTKLQGNGYFFLLLKIYKFCCLRARSSTPPVPSQKKPTVLQSIRRDCRYHRSIKRNYNLYIVIILQDSDECIDFVMWPCKSNCSGKIGKTGSWMEPTGTAACRAQPVLFRFNCEKKEKRSLYRLELARQYNIISPTNINPWYI